MSYFLVKKLLGTLLEVNLLSESEYKTTNLSSSKYPLNRSGDFWPYPIPWD